MKQNQNSDWRDEAELALIHAKAALAQSPTWQEDFTARNEIAVAIMCLDTAISSLSDE